MQRLGYNESKQRGSFGFPIEFYHLDRNHHRYVMSYHWHMEYEIIRILEGHFAISLDEREYLAGKGDILILNSGTLHGGTPEDCVYQCIVFDMDMLLKRDNICSKYIKDIINHTHLIQEYYPASFMDISPGASPEASNVSSLDSSVDASNDSSLDSFMDASNGSSLESSMEASMTSSAGDPYLPFRQHIHMLFDTIQKKSPGYELVTQGLLYLILGDITENHFFTSDSGDTKRNHKRIHLLKQVLELMEDSYQTSLTLEQLSKAAGMSSKYFCRFFQEMTHKSPFDYLNHYRIERACYQLLSTEDTITEIAYGCGFNDLSYFIKLFKRYKGTTPAKYRKSAFL